MTGSTALDVVIGLVFIYSLYSLLTTTLTELVAVWIQLRATFLKKAICRMLDDDSNTRIFSEQFYQQPLIKYMASSSTWAARKPSYLSGGNFSKNLIETIKQAYMLKVWESYPGDIRAALAKSTHQPLTQEVTKKLNNMIVSKRFNVHEIRDILQDPAHIAADPQTVAALESFLDETERLLNLPLIQKILDVLRDPKREIGHSETVRHLRSLLEDAHNDLEKFNALLAQWYDDTMERVTGWYRHWIQIITFFIGLGVAILFNADTIFIVNTLSRDNDSRDQLVQMATAYIESHPEIGVTCDSCETNARLDSLLKVKKEIEADIHAANSLLGLGWDFPDSVPLLTNEQKISIKSADKTKTIKDSDFITVNINDTEPKRYIQLTNAFPKPLASRLLKYCDDFCHVSKCDCQTKAGCLVGVNKTKTHVMLSEVKLFWSGLGGFILTAFAISLGAPFWFDLLNKLVKLRTSIRPPTAQETATASASTDKKQVPTDKRAG